MEIEENTTHVKTVKDLKNIHQNGLVETINDKFTKG